LLGRLNLDALQLYTDQIPVTTEQVIESTRTGRKYLYDNGMNNLPEILRSRIFIYHRCPIHPDTISIAFRCPLYLS
jgi:hypothetical protein